MILGKKVAIFNWEWGRTSAPREGQKMPCLVNVVGFFLQTGRVDIPF